jgi:hypothetical protein
VPQAFSQTSFITFQKSPTKIRRATAVGVGKEGPKKIQVRHLDQSAEKVK